MKKYEYYISKKVAHAFSDWIFLLFIILNCNCSLVDSQRLMKWFRMTVLGVWILQAGSQRGEESRAFGPFIAGNEVCWSPQDWQSLPTPPLCLSTDLKSSSTPYLSLSSRSRCFQCGSLSIPHICPELAVFYLSASCLCFSAFNLFFLFSVSGTCFEAAGPFSRPHYILIS